MIPARWGLQLLLCVWGTAVAAPAGHLAFILQLSHKGQQATRSLAQEPAHCLHCLQDSVQQSVETAAACRTDYSAWCWRVLI
jgi:hypothetical protein